MLSSNRFKKLADKLGFKIKPVCNLWFNYGNNKFNCWKNRPDILSVQYNRKHLMTIPKRMYTFSKAGYRTMDNKAMFRNFFEYEHKLKNWYLLIKRSPDNKKIWD